MHTQHLLILNFLFIDNTWSNVIRLAYITIIDNVDVFEFLLRQWLQTSMSSQPVKKKLD